jgi:hypothetical protein
MEGALELGWGGWIASMGGYGTCQTGCDIITLFKYCSIPAQRCNFASVYYRALWLSLSLSIRQGGLESMGVRLHQWAVLNWSETQYVHANLNIFVVKNGLFLACSVRAQ